MDVKPFDLEARALMDREIADRTIDFLSARSRKTSRSSLARPKFLHFLTEQRGSNFLWFGFA
jgi:hypothetical protein